MSITWEQPEVLGHGPSPRSGHTFTNVGGRFFVFGGCGNEDGHAKAFNDLYELDTSGEDMKWKKFPVNADSPLPPPRARHAAIPLDDKNLLIFGGLDKRHRFDDLWVFNTNDKVWTQVVPSGDAKPDARAHFTATKFFDRVIVFGGYGGNGQVYNDVWILHVESPSSMRWENISEQVVSNGAKPPTPRFDHSAFIYPVTPNSDTFDKLVIMGGRDLSNMFTDAHLLDLKHMVWSTEAAAPGLQTEVCNNLCDGVESVPYHKVFSFGGKRGMMQYMNNVEVMDAGSEVWSSPPVAGGTPPCGREDAAWVYDPKSSALIIFGGWANRWLGDVHKLVVAPIVGPPYACTDIHPKIGPVFGSSEVLIKGLRFRDGKIQVKFGANEKNEVLADGEFVDSETIRCRTPNYENFGAMPVNVYVSISGEGWTVNKIRYEYFANTFSRNCLAYGPGLLEKGVFGVEMPFLVQAKDTLNEKRQSGGDAFSCRVVSVGTKVEVEGRARVRDLENGMYEVLYMVPQPGKYKVHVFHADLGTPEPSHIRGSPFTIVCEDPWTKHRVMGAAPGKRKGVTLTALGSDLVAYGGDKSGISVCAMSAGDWRWSAPTPAGEAPEERTLHAAVNRKDP